MPATPVTVAMSGTTWQAPGGRGVFANGHAKCPWKLPRGTAAFTSSSSDFKDDLLPLDNTRSAATSPSYNASRAAYGMNAIGWIALVLMIVGGINWGLVGLFNFDLVAALFGPMTFLSRSVYVLVGIAALYGVYLAIKQASPKPVRTL